MSGIPLAEFCDIVEDGLGTGMRTDEIADSLGLQYESVRRRLHKNGKDELRLRLIERRGREWKAHRPYYPYNYERNRCHHGAWSSSGDCEHGAMGRYAKEKQSV